MSYRIEFKKSAAKSFASLPRQAQTQVGRQVDSLAANPYPEGCRKLKGREDLFRIRAGSYRIIYTVIQERIIVYVLAIGDRKEIYDQLKRL